MPEGAEQVQNQGNTGATDGQDEHQNNGPRRASASSRALAYSESGTPTAQNQHSLNGLLLVQEVNEDSLFKKTEGTSSMTDQQVDASMAAMRIFEEVTTANDASDQSPSTRSSPSTKSEWHESQGFPPDSVKCEMGRKRPKTIVFIDCDNYGLAIRRSLMSCLLFCGCCGK